MINWCTVPTNDQWTSWLKSPIEAQQKELSLGFWSGCSDNIQQWHSIDKQKKASFKTSISGINGHNRSEEILLQSLMAFLSWLSDFILGASKLTITKSEASWFAFWKRVDLKRFFCRSCVPQASSSFNSRVLPLLGNLIIIGFMRSWTCSRTTCSTNICRRRLPFADATRETGF